MRTLALFAFKLNLSVVLLDKGVDEGQPQTMPAGFRREERVEHLLQVFLWNAAASVLHMDFNPIALLVLFPIGRNPVAPKGEISVLRHCLKCIRKELEQHLLDLGRIAKSLRNIPFALRMNPDPGLLCPSADPLYDLLSEIEKVECCFLW